MGCSPEAAEPQCQVIQLLDEVAMSKLCGRALKAWLIHSADSDERTPGSPRHGIHDDAGYGIQAVPNIFFLWTDKGWRRMIKSAFPDLDGLAGAQVNKLIDKFAIRLFNGSRPFAERTSAVRLTRLPFRQALDATLIAKPGAPRLPAFDSNVQDSVLLRVPNSSGHTGDEQNSSVNTAELVENMCRICFEEKGHVISPCLCAGSQKWVHPECLQQCQRVRGLVCPTCNSQYRCNLQTVPALIEALQHGSQEAQTDAAADLRNLALTSQYRDSIRAEGGIHALIVVLCEGNQRARAHAAGALQNLAENSQNRDAIHEEGGIQPLIQVLREVQHANGSRAALQDDIESQLVALAAGALRNVACNRQSLDVIYDEGGIPILINVLQKGNGLAQSSAKEALVEVAENSQSHEVIGEVIRALLKVLLEAGQFSEKCAADAIKILASRSSQNQDLIRAEGGVEVCFKVLHEGRSELAQRTAADALTHLIGKKPLLDDLFNVLYDEKEKARAQMWQSLIWKIWHWHIDPILHNNMLEAVSLATMPACFPLRFFFFFFCSSSLNFLDFLNF